MIATKIQQVKSGVRFRLRYDHSLSVYRVDDAANRGRKGGDLYRLIDDASGKPIETVKLVYGYVVYVIESGEA
jgi:hypothetical protein